MAHVMYLDPLHLCIALAPLGVYLLLLGALNLAARPFCTTGARDAAALGLALSGFAVIGPMELFWPEAAAMHLGAYVWLLLLTFYVMCVVLVVLLARPRLVIYNLTADQLRPILANLVGELDSTARWAGDSLALPQLGVQFYLEPFGSLRNLQLVAAGPRQSFSGWRKFEMRLRGVLQQTRTSPNPYGVSLVLFGLMMVGMVTFAAVHDSPAIVRAFGEFLQP